MSKYLTKSTTSATEEIINVGNKKTLCHRIRCTAQILSANITIHVIFKEKSQHAVLAFKHAEKVELEAAV